MNVLFSSSDSISPHVGIVARKSYLESNREMVKNFLQAYSDGAALLVRDKEAVKKYLTLSPQRTGMGESGD